MLLQIPTIPLNSWQCKLVSNRKEHITPEHNPWSRMNNIPIVYCHLVVGGHQALPSKHHITTE
jgi:hypothetical protein